MVRLTARTLAQIGRLQTPPPEALMQGDQKFKGRKLFRDVRALVLLQCVNTNV